MAEESALIRFDPSPFRRRCRSCSAPIFWAFTGKGGHLPVDFDPVPHGNLRIIPSMARAVPPMAVVVPAVSLFPDEADDGTRYISHFASCPDADEHRKSA